MPDPQQPSAWMLMLVGLVVGACSGVFGIGGGVLVIPALVFLFGFSQQRATGTSLALLLPPLGILAVLEYWRKGNVDARAAVWIAVFMTLGAGLGAVAANRLPAAYLRMAFGAFLTGLGVWMFWRGWHNKIETPILH